jgi:hypothetical protein
MTLNTRLTELLHFMRDELLAFDDRLTESQRAETGAPDHWSAKDEVAHCIVWTGRTLADVQAIAAGEPKPERESEDFDEENLLIFERHRNDTWEEVKEMVLDTYGRLDAFLDGKSEDDLLAHPEEQEYPVWREVAGNGISHPMFHIWEYLEKHGHAGQISCLFGNAFFDRMLALHDDPGWQGTATYNLACQHALSGQSEQAIEYLDRALHLNPGLKEWSRQDSDLDSLRDMPGYQALYSEA